MAKKSGATCKRFVAAGVLLVLCGALMALFTAMGSALFPAYRSFSKGLVGVLSAVTGVVPVAVWDLLAVVLAALALVSLVHRLMKRRPILPWLSTVCCVVAALLVLFVGGWALNHYAPPLADELDLDVDQYTTEELAEATQHYLQRAAELSLRVPRDEEGVLVRQDFFELARIAGCAYTDLGEHYEVFNGGSTAPVKALLLAGEPLLYSGHVGIFMPLTGEANVPLNCAVAEIPFTMCHEAGHRLGLAGEQEANFAAFLASSSSDDVRFAYAGYYSAAGYCLNALYANDYDRGQDLVASFADSEDALGVQLFFWDRGATREHYAAYEGPAKEAGTAVNDTYLKTFGESEGVKSYGLVVDYLIAWYKAEGSSA